MNDIEVEERRKEIEKLINDSKAKLNIYQQMLSKLQEECHHGYAKKMYYGDFGDIVECTCPSCGKVWEE